MQQEQDSILQQSREEKIKSLGFLCYNLYVDGVITFPEMRETVEEIRISLNYLLALQKGNTEPDVVQTQEEAVTEKITELGCICYNLYVDNRLFNHKVLSLCDSISSINFDIANGLSSPLIEEPKSAAEEEKKEEEKEKPISENKNTTGSDLKVSCPYGMEPIPPNYKKCACGYRNKHIARFCGKCGAKLP